MYNQVRIKQVIQHTASSKTFVLEPLPPWQPVYEAGQFITLVFRHHDKEIRRSYSFSSSPVLDSEMQITIKRVDNGAYSRWWVSHVQAGMIMEVAGIGGRFLLPEHTDGIRGFFFLAAGSGITPVYSLLRTALHTGDLPVTLVYSNRSPGDVIFYQELKELQAQYPERLQVEYLFSNADDYHRSRLSKWLLVSLLQRYRIPLSQTLFYLCGPENYMLLASIVLVSEGIPRDHIRRENYDATPRSSRPLPPDTAPHRVTINMAGRSATLNVQYPDTILAAARKINIPIPYSCETGRCGSCIARCTAGKVWMPANEVLLDTELQQGLILTCIAYPVAGDVTIEV